MKVQADKEYKAPFDLSEDEFRRIREVIFQQLDKYYQKDSFIEKLEIKLSNGAILEDIKFDDIFSISNEKGELIEHIDYIIDIGKSYAPPKVKLTFSAIGYNKGITYKIVGEHDFVKILSSHLNERITNIQKIDWLLFFSFSGLFGYSILATFCFFVIAFIFSFFMPESMKSIEKKIVNQESIISNILTIPNDKFVDTIKLNIVVEELKKINAENLNTIESLIEYEKAKANASIQYEKNQLKLRRDRIEFLRINDPKTYDKLSESQNKLEQLALKKELLVSEKNNNEEESSFRRFKTILIVVYSLWLITILFLSKTYRRFNFIWGSYKSEFEKNQGYIKNYILVLIVGLIVSIVGGIITNGW